MVMVYWFHLLCVSGVGVALLYAATLTITCLYFDKKRVLALGIGTTDVHVTVASLADSVLRH